MSHPSKRGIFLSDRSHTGDSPPPWPLSHPRRRPGAVHSALWRSSAGHSGNPAARRFSASGARPGFQDCGFRRVRLFRSGACRSSCEETVGLAAKGAGCKPRLRVTVSAPCSRRGTAQCRWLLFRFRYQHNQRRLVDSFMLFEAAERKRTELWRFYFVNKIISQEVSRSRGGHKLVPTPTAVQDQSLYLIHLAQQWAKIWGHVDDPGPLAEQRRL